MRYTIFLSLLLFFTSCASILSKKIYNIPLSSTPSEAKLTIVDKVKESKGAANTVVFKGTTPANITLNASAGFFKKASGYNVEMTCVSLDEFWS